MAKAIPGRYDGIECPECGSTQCSVVDTRPQYGGTYRRRICVRCEHRFTTREVINANDIPMELYNKLAEDVGNALRSIESLNNLIQTITPRKEKA